MAAPDPTYRREDIEANPEWALAWRLSEVDNDNAPIGWFKYTPIARWLLSEYLPPLMREFFAAGWVARGKEQTLRAQADGDRQLAELAAGDPVEEWFGAYVRDRVKREQEG